LAVSALETVNNNSNDDNDNNNINSNTTTTTTTTTTNPYQEIHWLLIVETTIGFLLSSMEVCFVATRAEALSTPLLRASKMQRFLGGLLPTGTSIIQILFKYNMTFLYFISTQHQILCCAVHRTRQASHC
jgi:hypothetical protein